MRIAVFALIACCACASLRRPHQAERRRDEPENEPLIGSCSGECSRRFERCVDESDRAAKRNEALLSAGVGFAEAADLIGGVRRDKSWYQAQARSGETDKMLGFEKCRTLGDYCMAACSEGDYE